MKKTKPGNRNTSRIIWHPAFVQAIQLELMHYKKVLQYLSEYQLNLEPLRIDVVIIKKPKDTVIEKNIASIFRAENLVEYKSPGDYVSVWDFTKVYGYACLYSVLNGIPLTDLSISFVESHDPAELLAWLREVHGYSVENPGKGIYIIKGNVIPMQIINSRELSAQENLWLKDLDDTLDAGEIQRIGTAMRQLGKTRQTGAYLEVITKANIRLVR